MNTVRTKEELKAAKDRGDVEFIVEGDLLTKLRTARPIISFGAGALAIITAGIHTVPFAFVRLSLLQQL